ncbi:hypothetical protein [Deinococcus sp. QL22]|nr:hypothetical protein [Deinococcus sp. QL22]
MFAPDAGLLPVHAALICHHADAPRPARAAAPWTAQPRVELTPVS